LIIANSIDRMRIIINIIYVNTISLFLVMQVYSCVNTQWFILRTHHYHYLFIFSPWFNHIQKLFKCTFLHPKVILEIFDIAWADFFQQHEMKTFCSLFFDHSLVQRLRFLWWRLAPSAITMVKQAFVRSSIFIKSIKLSNLNLSIL